MTESTAVLAPARAGPGPLSLEDGSRVGSIGGEPVGSFAAYSHCRGIVSEFPVSPAKGVIRSEGLAGTGLCDGP